MSEPMSDERFEQAKSKAESLYMCDESPEDYYGGDWFWEYGKELLTEVERLRAEFGSICELTEDSNCGVCDLVRRKISVDIFGEAKADNPPGKHLKRLLEAEAEVERLKWRNHRLEHRVEAMAKLLEQEFGEGWFKKVVQVELVERAKLRIHKEIGDEQA